MGFAMNYSLTRPGSKPIQKWQSRQEILKSYIDTLSRAELLRVRPDLYASHVGFASRTEAPKFKYDSSQPRVPAGTENGGQWTGGGLGGAIRRPFRLASARISQAREAECEAMRRRDEIQCRFVGLRACWTQAYLRYGNCLAGLPIPLLNY